MANAAKPSLLSYILIFIAAGISSFAVESFTVTGYATATYCGDGGIQNPNTNGRYETCDGSNFGGKSCSTFGYSGGSLKCDMDSNIAPCQIDTSACTGTGTSSSSSASGSGAASCGNGQIDAGEECDGSNFGGKSCQSFGYAGGNLVCSTTPDDRGLNCQIGTRYCTNTQSTPSSTSPLPSSPSSGCGNGVIDPGEECDTNGPIFGGKTCQTYGYSCGSLYCDPNPDDRGRECQILPARTCSNSCGGGSPPSSPAPPAPTNPCGNGACDSGETCSSCSADCGTCPSPIGPSLSLSQNSFSFAMEQGGSGPSSSLTVTNAGSGLLSWSVSDDAAWLTVRRNFAGGEMNGVESAGGSSTPSLSVSIDGSGLAAGTYNAAISVSSNGGSASVPVTLTVSSRVQTQPSPPSNLEITDTAWLTYISFRWSHSSPTACDFNIYRSKDGSPFSKIAKTSNLLYTDRSSFTAGTYSYYVTCVLPDAESGPSNTISWTNQASASQPILAVMPASFGFSAAQGSNPGSSFLTISNAGSDLLSWSVSDNANWLAVSRNFAGGETNGVEGTGASSTPPLTVSMNTAGLSAGTYTATISVASNGGNANIPVTLTVRAAITANCKDSDGRNYYVRGTSQQCYSDGSCQLERAEACINATTLREDYCENNYVKSEYYNCSYGCSNGQCNAKQTDSAQRSQPVLGTDLVTTCAVSFQSDGKGCFKLLKDGVVQTTACDSYFSQKMPTGTWDMQLESISPGYEFGYVKPIGAQKCDGKNVTSVYWYWYLPDINKKCSVSLSSNIGNICYKFLLDGKEFNSSCAPYGYATVLGPKGKWDLQISPVKGFDYPPKITPAGVQPCTDSATNINWYAEFTSPAGTSPAPPSPPLVNSCKGRCGNYYNSSANCQCDSGCKDIGDCCKDYDFYCNQSITPTPKLCDIFVTTNVNSCWDLLRDGKKILDKPQCWSGTVGTSGSAGEWDLQVLPAEGYSYPPYVKPIGAQKCDGVSVKTIAWDVNFNKIAARAERPATTGTAKNCTIVSSSNIDGACFNVFSTNAVYGNLCGRSFNLSVAPGTWDIVLASKPGGYILGSVRPEGAQTCDGIDNTLISWRWNFTRSSPPPAGPKTCRIIVASNVDACWKLLRDGNLAVEKCDDNYEFIGTEGRWDLQISPKEGYEFPPSIRPQGALTCDGSREVAWTMTFSRKDSGTLGGILQPLFDFLFGKK